MSFKATLAHGLDRAQLSFFERARPNDCQNIALTPVFHVEQLFIDRYFENMRRFLHGYRALTQRAAVLTCMTPHSPILAHQLEQSGIAADRYWDRLQTLAEDGIVGLHGHFLRAPMKDPKGASVKPMHCAFHDMQAVEEQIALELDALRGRDLVKDDLLIYSAGWWFITPALRRILARKGFGWDYSLSSSIFNISPGSAAIETQVAPSGLRVQTIENRQIRSATAVCGIARKDRPFKAISKVMAEAKHQGGANAVLSLYAHDFDLDPDAALRMTERFCAAGFQFAEPTVQ